MKINGRDLGPSSRFTSAGRRLILFALLSLFLFPEALNAEVTSIWAVNDGEKVYRFQQDHPAKAANSIWDGKKISLRGLGNEVVAFQIIVETDHEGVDALEVLVGPITHRDSGSVIGSSTPGRYGPNGVVEVFTEHYIHVERPTPKGWFFGSEASAPPRGTGWVPDPLIPPQAASGKGGFPVDVDALGERRVAVGHEIHVLPPPEVQNQGFWIDVYLPRDVERFAGIYEGRVQVLSGGREIAAIPVEIEVLKEVMPDQNHTTVWLYTSNVGRYYPDMSADEVRKMVKFTAHRHRIDAVGGFDAHRSRFDPEIMSNYLPYLDGSGFSPAAGYWGPGQGVGETLFPVGMYGSRVMGDTREVVQRESDRWVEWFREHAPEVVFFWYLVDEPGESYYPWIKERADWIHLNPGSGRELPVFITTGYIEELAGDIDIWCNYDGVELDLLPMLKEQSKRYWFYNGHRPRYGSVLLEAEAVDFRVNAWAKYIHDVDVWFLWEGTHWTHNHSGPKGFLHQRVFTEPATFSSWSGVNANGDGIVFYPGKNPFYPSEDRGLNELLGSIRLKNIRRGQQDYEIMWLAEQKAGREAIIQMVREVVPESFEADKEGPVKWPQRGDPFDLAREKLLDIIVE